VNFELWHEESKLSIRPKKEIKKTGFHILFFEIDNLTNIKHLELRKVRSEVAEKYFVQTIKLFE